MKLGITENTNSALSKEQCACGNLKKIIGSFISFACQKSGWLRQVKLILMPKIHIMLTTLWQSFWSIKCVFLVLKNFLVFPIPNIGNVWWISKLIDGLIYCVPEAPKCILNNIWIGEHDGCRVVAHQNRMWVQWVH